MRKNIAVLSITLAAMLMGPSQAIAQIGGCQNKYLTRMYSDNTYMEQVGYIDGICAYPYILYTLHGTYTNFQTEEVDGDCSCGPIEY